MAREVLDRLDRKVLRPVGDVRSAKVVERKRIHPSAPTHHFKISNQIICCLTVRLPVALRAAIENVKQPGLTDEDIPARIFGHNCRFTNN
jgi:hypothetical protein